MKEKSRTKGYLLDPFTHIDSQTVYHANGDVNIFPCSYEWEKAPLTANGSLSKRGKMVIEENGVGHFKAYKEGTGERFNTLFTTESGELYASQRNTYVRIKLSNKVSACRMMEALAKQMGEICDFIKNNM